MFCSSASSFSLDSFAEINLTAGKQEMQIKRQKNELLLNWTHCLLNVFLHYFAQSVTV